MKDIGFHPKLQMITWKAQEVDDGGAKDGAKPPSQRWSLGTALLHRHDDELEREEISSFCLKALVCLF